MAFLLVKVQDETSLLLNEFYDYNGYCYANYDIDLQDFYEAPSSNGEYDNVAVIFMSTLDLRIVGWYKSATISSKIDTVSLFLQGNIKAAASEVVLLSVPIVPESKEWYCCGNSYEVIEQEDSRFLLLNSIMNREHKNLFKRYPYVHIELDAQSKGSATITRQYCELLAGNLMDDNCQGLHEIKALEKYSEKLIRLDRQDADGYYYHSLACYHLGFVKPAIKSIEKAIEIEGESSDLIAQKANILCSMRYYDKAQQLYDKAFRVSQDELYRVYQGRALILAGRMEQAFEVFDSVSDKQLLEECGINTKIESMDKKWSFSTILRRLKRE